MYKEKIYIYHVEGIFVSWCALLYFFAFRYVQNDEIVRDYRTGNVCPDDGKKPAAQMYNKVRTIVYENEAVFRQEVSGTGEVSCIVGWQCCNGTICMPPTEVEISVK